MDLLIRLPSAAVLLFGLAAGLISTQAAGQEAQLRYVVADVVKLRQWPDRGALVVANLRIDTAVRLLDGGRAPEGWTKVAVEPGDKAEYDITGYVASAFLSDRRPTVAALLEGHRAQMAAGDLAVARNSAERLVALDPVNPEHVERLRALYRRLGKDAGAARLTTYLQGNGEKYVGYCTSSGLAVLLAKYQPGAEIDPRARPIPTAFRGQGSIELAQALQRMPWFSFDPAGEGRSRHMPGGWIMDSGFLRGMSTQVNWELHRPAKCTAGTVFSNEPLRAVDTGPFDPDTDGGLIQATPKMPKSISQPFTYHVAGSRRIFDGPGLASVLFQLDGKGGLLSMAGESFIWGLFDGDDGDLLTLVGTYYPGYGYALVSRVTWVAWASSPVRVAIVEGSSYEDKGSGISGTIRKVFVVEEENGRARLLTLR